MKKMLIYAIYSLLIFGVNYVDASPLRIKSNNLDVELLLVDYEGRKVGYDHINKKEIKETEDILGGYGRDASDNTGIWYNEVSYMNPKSGLYMLSVYAVKDTQYNVGIVGSNEIMEHVKIGINGMLQKGEVQQFKILYSLEANEKTTATKVLDLNVYEREAKAIFNNENSEINKIMKEVFGNIKKAKKVVKKDSAKAKEYIKTIAEVTETARKEFLASSGKPMDLSLDYKYDRVNTWEWYRDNVLKYDILILDAQELVKQIK